MKYQSNAVFSSDKFHRNSSPLNATWAPLNLPPTYDLNLSVPPKLPAEPYIFVACLFFARTSIVAASQFAKQVAFSFAMRSSRFVFPCLFTVAPARYQLKASVLKLNIGK